MKAFAYSVASGLLAAILAVPAAAQQHAVPAPGAICGDREVIVTNLGEQHKEHQIGVAMVNENMVLEFFSSEGGETWTIIATVATGKSCLLSSGEYLSIRPIVPGRPS